MEIENNNPLSPLLIMNEFLFMNINCYGSEQNNKFYEFYIIFSNYRFFIVKKINYEIVKIKTLNNL